MKWILILGALLLVLRLLGPVLRLLVATVAGRAIGAAALRNQPDAITLTPAGTAPWRRTDQAEATTAEFRGLGYSDAGVFLVREMPGVVVRLMAHPRDSLYAALYEHPQAGQWFDVGRRMQDGTSFALTTSRDMGLAQRPGHPMTHVPGLTPTAVHARAVAQPAAGWPQPVRVEHVVREFERVYAESMAWRKQTGITTGEVVKVATRKIA